MKLGTKREMNQLDEMAISNYLIPSVLLMEQAASRLYEYISQEHSGKEILILCGPGNNGGDGLALARQLVCLGKENVTIGFVADSEKLSRDGKCYQAICEKLCIPSISLLDEQDKLYTVIESSDVIVDCIFGTGLTRVVEGATKALFVRVNQSKAFKVSIDIPSGIQCDTGVILGEAIKADCTITFQLGKVGQFVYPGLEYCGELRVVDIGIPQALVEGMACSHYVIEEQLASKLLPRRPIRSNKGTYGKILVIGGQIGMSGAICMTSLGAMRVGAGLVTMAVPKSLTQIVEQKVTEAMTLPLPEQDGHLSSQAADVLKEIIARYSVIAIGPGLGRDISAQRIMEVVLASDRPTVVDADGLYALKPYLEQMKLRKTPLILTPHVGEMSMLCEVSVEEILKDPMKYARNFSKRYGVITVLKLERMFIVDPASETLYIAAKGHQAVAKGGAGDVLTGFITGILACNNKPLEAALLGAYLHGDTSLHVVEHKGIYSVLPTDLLDYVGDSFKNLMSL